MTACGTAIARRARIRCEPWTARTRDEGFGPEVKRRIMLGTYVLSAGYYDAFYRKAQQVRTLIQADYEAAFVGVDVVATPTTPTAPFGSARKWTIPPQMYLADVFTVSANLTWPAISIRAASRQGQCLPLGLQLTGRAFDESDAVEGGDAYERATENWWKWRPSSGQMRARGHEGQGPLCPYVPD